METFFITLAVVAFSGGLVWLFLFEPRRKIHQSIKKNAPLSVTSEKNVMDSLLTWELTRKVALIEPNRPGKGALSDPWPIWNEQQPVLKNCRCSRNEQPIP